MARSPRIAKDVVVSGRLDIYSSQEYILLLSGVIPVEGRRNVMCHPIRRLAHRTTLVAVLVTLALALVPNAFGDGWARERADMVAMQGLDPALRTAIVAHSTAPTPVVTTLPRVSSSDDGFAWGAAALGLATGIAAMCAVLVCVSLMRHDGRLRNA
jgi:hypothetical protein